MSSVTVPGTGGSIISIPTTAGINTLLAQQIANALAAASQAGSLQVAGVTAGGAPPPTVPGGTTGEEVLSGNGNAPFALSPGYGYLVDTNTAADTIWGGSNQNFMLGAAGTTFFSGPSGNTTIQSGSGNNNVDLAAGAIYFVGLGAGNDTVWAAGSGTIDAGTGKNVIDLSRASSSANNFVVTEGQDTVAAGPGHTTIASWAKGVDVIGGSGTLYEVSAGNTTVNSGSGAETIFGASGDLVYGNNSSSLLFLSGSGPSTVIGGSTVATIAGSSGSDVTFVNGSTAGAVMVGGPGSERLSAQFSSSNNTLAGGSGNTTLIGGSGSAVFWAGSGTDSLVAGSGSDIFQFVHGISGSTEVIHGFKPTDLVGLSNYGANAATNALNSSVVSGFSTTITLSDNTKITFDDFVGLSSKNIVSNT